MRRLILFLVLAVALIAGLNIVSRVFDDRRHIDAMNALLDDTSGKEAIIVGSSIGGAIRFDTLSRPSTTTPSPHRGAATTGALPIASCSKTGAMA